MHFKTLLTTAALLLQSIPTHALPQPQTTTPSLIETRLCTSPRFAGTCNSYFSAEGSCMAIGSVLAGNVSSFSTSRDTYCIFYDADGCPHREWRQSGLVGGFLMVTSALETLGVWDERIKSYVCYRKGSAAAVLP
ncbi:hypothetical protein Vi05172_g370 [Venturia inaequalis]|nr:hypothetical protein Vi05172_g370 [Venturia inaequalis]